MRGINIIFVVWIGILLVGCKTKKEMQRTDLLSRGKLTTALDTAVMVLPIEARLADMQQFIEATFDTFSLGQPSDDLFISAKLQPGVRIGVDEDSIAFTIPMDVDITQKTFLGSVKADGVIALHLKSKYDIDSNWKLTTSTSLNDYNWIKSPKANVSVITLSIETLANRMIDKNKDQLTSNIDLQIASQVNLKKSINDIWYRLRAPMEVSEEYKVWLQMKPVELSISKLQTKDKKVIGYIKAKTSPRISVGARPVDFKLDSIPQFEWLEADTSGYLIPLKLTIPDQEIEDIANSYLEEESFDLGQKTLKIKDVSIERAGDNWLVDLEVYGDVNGRIQIKGKPIYDARKDKIELEDFEYEVDSRNLLLKGSALLFKQKVQKRLVDQLNAVVEDRKKEVLKSIDEQLLKTNENQWMGVDHEIDRFTIHTLGLDDVGMWMYVLMSGEAKARFKYQAAVK